MHVLFRYIFTAYLKHALIILCGLSLILLVFDVLANASDITQNTDHTLKTLFDYMRLRLPLIIILVLPMTSLLAAMLTMHKMVKSHEMVMIAGAGMTAYKVSLILMMAASSLAISSGLLSEYVASSSSIQLRLWAERDYAGSPQHYEIKKELWSARGNDLLYYKAASPDGTILNAPLIIQRKDDGILQTYISAQSAIYLGNSEWRFNQIKSTNQRDTETQDRLQINLPFNPDDFALPAKQFEETQISTLWQLVFNVSQQNTRYILWLQRKFAQPLSIILMALLASPIGLFATRQYNGLLVGFGFVIFGFSYFVIEKILISLGENGRLSTFFAVWSPLIIFGTLSSWFILYKQE